MAAVATPSWRYGPLGSDAGSDVMTITTERIVRAYDSAESFCTVYGGSADQMQLCDTTSMLPAWDAVASDSDLDSDSDGVASNDDLQDILSEAETSLDYFDLEELAQQSTYETTSPPRLAEWIVDDSDDDSVVDVLTEEPYICQADDQVEMPTALLKSQEHHDMRSDAPTNTVTDHSFRLELHEASAAYSFDATLGCMTPPPSPYVPIHLSSFLRQHPEVQQWMEEHQFSYPHRYPVAVTRRTESGVAPAGYDGDAWSTWNLTSERWSGSAPRQEQSTVELDDAYFYDNDDDEPYSPSDDWLFGAYGINGHQWTTEEAVRAS
jgi:hypothetical protein